MRIEIHLFAGAAQAAQARAVFVEVPGEASLADLSSALSQAYPQLQSLLPISRWAIDHQFAPLETIISDKQEIALIPPVSGG